MILILTMEILQENKGVNTLMIFFGRAFLSPSRERLGYETMNGWAMKP